MSNRQAQVSLVWGDGEYTFRLSLLGTIELEEKCDAPWTVIQRRVEAGEYKRSDLRETIRLGLIGGGMEPTKAMTLVKRYVDDRPGAESWMPARLILHAAIFGFVEDAKEDVAPAGKPEAAPVTPPSVSTPPASTEPPPSSGARLSTLLASRYGNGQQP